MIADGIFISSLIYVIQLWGGANKTLISSLQILQNKAARCTTKLGFRTPVKLLLQQCGWLSVRQLVFYHNCLFVFKTLHSQRPIYFSKKFGRNFQSGVDQEPVSLRTRLNSTGGQVKSDISHQAFSHVSAKAWNSLPAGIRQSKTIDSFKVNLRQWITQNMEIE